MNWIEFRGQVSDFGCYGVNQVYAWQPGFDRNNLTRWLERGYLTRLRQGLYAFSEYRGKPDMAVSRVSLHA